MSLPLLNIVHCNVNCSDLARSRFFYEQVVGLEARAHTAPEKPQDCRAFGFEGEGQWDAWILGVGAQETGVDLLEWKLPAPVGRPYVEPHHLGFARLGFGVPVHIHATLYTAMGIDPKLHLLDHSGRPTPVLEDPTPIAELL